MKPAARRLTCRALKGGNIFSFYAERINPFELSWIMKTKCSMAWLIPEPSRNILIKLKRLCSGARFQEQQQSCFAGMGHVMLKKEAVWNGSL